MARLLTIGIYTIALFCCDALHLELLSPDEARVDQPGPQAAKPSGDIPAGTLDTETAYLDISALCRCSPPPEDICECISETVILFDASISMTDRCEPEGQRKLEIAQSTFSDILDAVPTQHAIGVLSLENDVSLLSPLEPILATGKSSLRRAVMERKAKGSATLKRGLETIREMLAPEKVRPRLISVVVLTDGMTCRPADALSTLEELARQNRIRFNVVCIGCNRPHHDELVKLARTVNGRFHLVCSTRDLPRALTGIRQDYDDIWKCSLSERERYRHALNESSFEKKLLCRELNLAQQELTEIRKERTDLILKLETMSNVEKMIITRIDVRTTQIDTEVKGILNNLKDHPAGPENIDPKSIADEIDVRVRDWVWLLALLLVVPILLALASIFRSGRKGLDQPLKSSEHTMLMETELHAGTRDSTGTLVEPKHQSKPVESPCPPKTTAPPTSYSKYLGSRKQTPAHAPAGDSSPPREKP